MNKEHLLKVVETLETKVTDEQFDLGLWMNDCGTVGCAYGWYIYHNPNCGVSLRGNFFGDPVPTLREEHFEISARDFWYLFGADPINVMENTRLATIARIKRYVEEGGRPQITLIEI